MKTKYTKELLEPLVKSSTSLISVVRKLGITSYGGGTQSHIKKVIANYGIDTSHFLGQANNQGLHHVGGPAKRKPKSILVLLPVGETEKSRLLRRALIESGREYKCECCGQLPIWNGKSLVLQIDHKSGLRNDNRSDNLRFICPNCHTQTDNFCGKNKVYD